MLCIVCRHCGLCAGDGTFKTEKDMMIQVSGIGLESLKGRSDCTLNEIGIAIDIGSTTVAASCWSLKTAAELLNITEPNCQRIYGTDVIARITHAQTENGRKELSSCLQEQIKKIISRITGEVQFKFNTERKGRAVLSRTVITGNVTMLSFLLDLSVKNLGTYPFKPESLFDITVNQNGNEIYFPPAVSAFTGSDTVCAMTACGFNADESTVFLCDAGTNCEMAVQHEGKIFCTSSAAGPAFEGQGIEKGMTASEGAVAKISIQDKKIQLQVIGGKNASGICGTGILSACAAFYKNGIINENGTFGDESQRFYLSPEVYLSQKDIRNFQLAKAAVYSGLNALSEISKVNSDSVLYLAGGFGTKLDASDASFVKMIPEHLSHKVVPSGNAALSGAVLMLFDDEKKNAARKIAEKAVNVDLAQLPDFQKKYISALNF